MQPGMLESPEATPEDLDQQLGYAQSRTRQLDQQICRLIR